MKSIRICPSGRARGLAALLCACPFLLFPTLVRAGSTVLRWPELVERLRQHPVQAEADSRIAAARAEQRTAGALPNPVLAASAGLSSPQQLDLDRGVEWSASLSLPLQWLYQRGVQLDAARAGVDVAEQEARGVRQTALVQLRSLFWQLASDQALLAVLGETEQQLSELARLFRLRVTEGESRPVEALRIETELERLRSEQETARARAGGHRERLARWLGLELPATVKIDADLGTLPALPAQEELLRVLTERHPLLGADRARLRELTARVDLERRRRAPALSVTGFFTRELDRDVAGAGLELELPLWNLNEGGIARAEAELAAGQQRLEGDRRELAAAAADAWAELAGDHQAVVRLQQEILPRAELTARQTEESFRLGEANLIDLIDARRVLLAARRDLLAARLQLHLDHTALAALGGDIEHDWK